MMKWSRWMRTPVSLILAALILSACSTSAPPGPSDELSVPEVKAQDGGLVSIGDEVVGTEELVAAAKAEGTVTIYTANLQQEEVAMGQAFMSRFPGIKVEVVRLAGARLHERIMAEATAGKPAADVVIQSDVSLVEELFNKGMLGENTPPAAAEYPAPKRDNYWYAGSTTVMVFAYNTKLVAKEDAPKSWADLLDPKWAGKIGWVPAPEGGTSWALAYFQRQVLGEEYWQKLAAQKPLMLNGVAAVTETLIRGEIEVAYSSVGTTFPQRFYMGAPIDIVYPTEGSVVVPRPIGVMKDAQHPNAARLFMNWYLSKDGQERMSAVRGTLSIRPGITPPPGTPEGPINLYNPNVDEMETVREKWLQEWTQTFSQ